MKRTYEEKLLDIVSALVTEVHSHPFDAKDVSLDSTFEQELGLDSLSRVELISRVETAFNLALPDRTFSEAQTPRDLLRVLSTIKPSVSKTFLCVTPPIAKLSKNTPLPNNVKTLTQLLEWHATHHGDRIHIQFYEDDGAGETISYEKLHNDAQKIAASLQQYGLEKGEPVAIMLPTGAEYFFTFFGIMLAGGIPVPIYPPSRASQIEEHMRRHVSILQNCHAKILITVPEGKRVAQLLMLHLPTLKHILTAHEVGDSTFKAVLPVITEDDIAFLQYTSGSTGSPKGVVLTHANLLANIRAMGSTVNVNSDDVFVSWLPLYHDMGLIGAWLGSLYYAALFVVMSPLSFLAKPQRWLQAIQHYKGTLSASPNFGYEYVLHRLKDTDLTGLDLSSWRAAFNGAEAVYPSTLERFCNFFSPYGFNNKALMPVYGLAESSVGLAFPPLMRGPLIDSVQRDTFVHSQIAVSAMQDDPNPLRFVSSGLPLRGHQIRIVDPAGNELPQRHEGRLEFRGPSSTSGYYLDAQKTRSLFDGEWLDTGDLAYISDGELYITGRVKDIIIRAGRNIYPDELEKEIAEIPGIRKGCVAVFGSADPGTATERLIVLAESNIDTPDEQTALRQKINELASDLIGTPPDDIVLAPPGSVLKTSSGKIRRSASRKMYEDGEIGVKRKAVVWQIIFLTLSSILPQIRRLGSYLLACIYALYCWLIFSLIVPIAWIGAVLLPRYSLRWMAVHLSARLLVKALGIPIKIIGAQNLPRPETASIIVVNHASYIDSLVIAAILNEPIRFVAKSELSLHWMTRLPLQRLHAQFVERFDIDKSVKDAEALFDTIKSNKQLLFFPEGTFTRIPGLQPFHMGAFKAAAYTGVPLIPVALRGTRSILRCDSWFPRYGSITITIGTRIKPSSVGDRKSGSWERCVALRDEARTFILTHSCEPDLER